MSVDVIEKTEFTFDELSEKAQQRALENCRDELNHDWWEYVYEEAINIGKLIGIFINYSENAAPLIYFSGFYSQGDGCSYCGYLSVSQLSGAVARVEEYLGKGRETDPVYKLAETAQLLYQMILVPVLAQRMGAVHEPDSEVPIGLNDYLRITSSSGRSYQTYLEEYAGTKEIDSALNEYVQDFAEWIYARLEEEYDYRTSDEVTKESIDSNECLFDEFGSTL